MKGEGSSAQDLLTLPAVGRRYGVGIETLRKAVRSGALPAYAMGTRWSRVRRAELEEWIQSTRVPVQVASDGSGRPGS